MEVLQKYKFGAISNDTEREYTKETVLNFVNEQPTACNDGWIPCTVIDHPEHCNNCEVTMKDTIGVRRDIAYYTDKWRLLSDETPIIVTAWKEPSQPYKENENEESK